MEEACQSAPSSARAQQSAPSPTQQNQSQQQGTRLSMAVSGDMMGDVNKFANTLYTQNRLKAKCGDRWVIKRSDPITRWTIYELKDPKLVIKTVEITNANKLNGIEYVGDVEVGYTAERRYDPNTRQWKDWQEPSQHTLNVAFMKKNGVLSELEDGAIFGGGYGSRGSVSGGLYRGAHTVISCSEVQ